MLCVEAEEAGFASGEMFSSHGVALPANLGSSIQKAMQKVGGRRSSKSRRSDPGTVAEAAEQLVLPPRSASSSSTGEASGTASCSGVEPEMQGQTQDSESADGGRTHGRRSRKMRHYRSQLEEEVKKLQGQLQEQIDLHVTLADATAQTAVLLLESPNNLPYKTQELLATIASLESMVAKLEKELDDLNYTLCYERNERLLAETHLGLTSLLPLDPPSSRCMWEESVSSLRDTESDHSRTTQTMQDFLQSDSEDLHSVSDDGLQNQQEDKKISGMSVIDKDCHENNTTETSSTEPADVTANDVNMNLWCNPNQLSEEMVRCMRNIFLCLSESSKNSPGSMSSWPSSSPAGQSSCISTTSFSDSCIMPSPLQSPSIDSNQNDDDVAPSKGLDPYGVSGRENWGDIGSYSKAAEVSWMSVGKEQLEYASMALKKFRFLVEQLAKVNPANMTSDERLAFWINLYNALIMHAYLAYGVPRNDVKLFDLTQKACYTVGGLSVSAAEIEFVILKMKVPSHRPQIAVMLALHKFKITEEHKKYSVESPEPLTLFALSCGMFSSPALRIFSAENVRQELQSAMEDYVRASVGLSEKNKVMVPKLLHSFAKGVVEDSMLVDWICHHLSAKQVAIIRESTSQHKQRILGIRSFSVIPYESRFRYLFLPDYTESPASLRL